MAQYSTSTILDALKWRYATKVFDPARKIPEDTWAAVEESLVLTPSSFGLQPWKFIVVKDPALRESLVASAWNQRQVADASHLVVMAVRSSYTEADVDANVMRIAEVRGGTPDSLLGYKKMIMGSMVNAGYTDKEITNWTKCQAYIALGQLMTTAALLGLDACPMEGFEVARFDELLGLTARGLTTAVLCPVGYRSELDRYAGLPKVRFAAENVIEHI